MKIIRLASIHRAYHGTPGKIDSFTVQHSGGGADQEGPGIYFTSSYNDAASYTGPEGTEGSVVEVDLTLNKVVSLSGAINENEIRQLVLWSCGLESEGDLEKLEDNDDYWETTLCNWGESPYGAFESVVSIGVNADDPHDAFQSIWYALYRYDPADYLSGMIKLGYDGVIIPKKGLTHYVMYNPDSITRV